MFCFLKQSNWLSIGASISNNANTIWPWLNNFLKCTSPIIAITLSWYVVLWSYFSNYIHCLFSSWFDLFHFFSAFFSKHYFSCFYFLLILLNELIRQTLMILRSNSLISTNKNRIWKYGGKARKHHQYNLLCKVYQQIDLRLKNQIDGSWIQDEI